MYVCPLKCSNTRYDTKPETVSCDTVLMYGRLCSLDKRSKEGTSMHSKMALAGEGKMVEKAATIPLRMKSLLRTLSSSFCWSARCRRRSASSASSVSSFRRPQHCPQTQFTPLAHTALMAVHALPNPDSGPKLAPPSTLIRHVSVTPTASRGPSVSRDSSSSIKVVYVSNLKTYPLSIPTMRPVSAPMPTHHGLPARNAVVEGSSG
mmetsp:Transcript_10272/g.19726  ORF Transcript_10272/g.19726 Transcript_10272/m.19726 type:complete len:206 (+) Transcript_10272:929-1546(+)